MGDGTVSHHLSAMFTLLYIGILLAVLLTAVVVHAVAAAPEGYEDQGGFHVMAAGGASDAAMPSSTTLSRRAQRELPPVVLTR
jgi:hypothetical protein